MFLNLYIADANGGKMPTDESILNKYNLELKSDYKHENILKEPTYPQFIDKYYCPILSVIRKEVYSLGDLISYWGILLFFAVVIITMRNVLIKMGYKFRKY